MLLHSCKLPTGSAAWLQLASSSCAVCCCWRGSRVERCEVSPPCGEMAVQELLLAVGLDQVCRCIMHFRRCVTALQCWCTVPRRFRSVSLLTALAAAAGQGSHQLQCSAHESLAKAIGTLAVKRFLCCAVAHHRTCSGLPASAPRAKPRSVTGKRV